MISLYGEDVGNVSHYLNSVDGNGGNSNPNPHLHENVVLTNGVKLKMVPIRQEENGEACNSMAQTTN